MSAPIDHLHEAAACLRLAGGEDDDSATERSLLGRGGLHALLVIADRLGPLSRLNRDSDHALQVAAWLIANRGGAEAAWVIDNLVRHAKGVHYAGAADLAQIALDRTTGREHYAVAQAIATLKIVLPA